MKEDYVSFEVAKLLKEKGFDVSIHSVWIDHSKLVNCPAAIAIYQSAENWNTLGDELDDIYFSAPTHQMAMAWLREKGIIITMDYDEYELISDNKKVGYRWGIQKTEKPTEYLKISIHVFDNYEEAVEDAIKYCLTNLV
jgi:hypothetical protein